ncbi:methionine aminotransferase [Flavobacterium capsici]|uniref:Methionine aminotransferase n=2 Tax=Flavobacterium capsici TaxID=3075618 RepID=A0AA96F5F0_9FLAO|nr:methionine aminotransferase [Flavobacterium sp. PMTSA4]WNM23132.1 methionine aminotransferase [Flavobacterium sp. PMTSA4]
MNKTMSKLPHINTSIFSVMTQMAIEYKAINLAQGFPNFPLDERLTSILVKLSNENIHQYAPMAGNISLLEKIATLTATSYRRKVNPKDEILVSAGATEGIFATIQALVHPNEEVIILDPSYDCYETPILLCNAKPIRINLKNDFTPNWELIGNTINQNTKLIIINNPHNPSGRIWNENDFIQLEKLLELYPKLLVLSDEVYEYITFEQKHISIHHRPKLWNRSISVSSFGKTFHITGWKIGYLIAPIHLMNEIKKVHQFLVFSVNSVAQVALSAYLDIVDIPSLASFYQQKRDFFRTLLADTKFNLLPCEGTYFQTVSYATISNENDIDFTKRLVKEIGVATIPISTFNADGKDNHCIRFCFAKDDETLIQAAEKLKKL